MSRLSPISLASEPPHSAAHPGGHIANYNPSHSTDLLPSSGYNPHTMPPGVHNTHSPHPGGQTIDHDTSHMYGHSTEMLPSSGYTSHSMPPSVHSTQTLPSSGHTSHQPSSGHNTGHSVHPVLPSGGAYNVVEHAMLPSVQTNGSGLIDPGNNMHLSRDEPRLTGKGPRLPENDSGPVSSSMNTPVNTTKTPAQLKAFMPSMGIPGQHQAPSTEISHTRVPSDTISHNQVKKFRIFIYCAFAAFSLMGFCHMMSLHYLIKVSMFAAL